MSNLIKGKSKIPRPACIEQTRLQPNCNFVSNISLIVYHYKISDFKITDTIVSDYNETNIPQIIHYLFQKPKFSLFNLEGFVPKASVKTFNGQQFQIGNTMIFGMGEILTNHLSQGVIIPNNEIEVLVHKSK